MPIGAFRVDRSYGSVPSTMADRTLTKQRALDFCRATGYKTCCGHSEREKVDDTQLALEILKRGLADPTALEDCRQALNSLRARRSSATFAEILLDRRIVTLAQLEEIRSSDRPWDRSLQERIFEELLAAEASAEALSASRLPPPPIRRPSLPPRLRWIAFAASAGCLVLLTVMIFRLTLTTPSLAAPAAHATEAHASLPSPPPPRAPAELGGPGWELEGEAEPERARAPRPEPEAKSEPERVPERPTLDAPSLPHELPASVPIPEPEPEPEAKPKPEPESVPEPDPEPSRPPPNPGREPVPNQVQWRAWIPALLPPDELPRKEAVRLRDGRIFVGELVSVDARGVALRVGAEEAPRRFDWEKFVAAERARIERAKGVPLLDDGWVDGLRVVTDVRTVEGIVLREEGETLWLQSAEAGRPVAIACRAIRDRESVRLPERWALSPAERLARRVARVPRDDAGGWLRTAALAILLGIPESAEELLLRAQGAGASPMETAAVREVARLSAELRVPLDRDWARSPAAQKDRFLSIRRVARLEHPAALLLLLHLIRTEQTSVGRIAALLGVRQMKRPEAVAPLIAIVRGLGGDLRDAVLDTLTALTGVERATFESWRDWWNENGEAWLDGRFVVRGPLRHAGSTRLFYGLPIDAKRLVFTLDVSGSMGEMASYSEVRMILSEIPESHDGIIRRIDVARWQLRRVLRGLPADARFNLVLFDSEPRVYAPSLLEASKENVARAIECFDATEPGSGTNILGAVVRAFELLEPEEGAVYLISDGLPTPWRAENLPALIAEVKKRTRNGRVRVHTAFIASSIVYEFDQGKELMERIAATTGGKFVCLGVRPE